MPPQKNLSIETIYESFHSSLIDSIDFEELTEEALSVPIIKKKFEEFLLSCGITEGITEDTIEAGFFNWLDESLNGVEMVVKLNIEHLYEE